MYIKKIGEGAPDLLGMKLCSPRFAIHTHSRIYSIPSVPLHNIKGSRHTLAWTL